MKFISPTIKARIKYVFYGIIIIVSIIVGICIGIFYESRVSLKKFFDNTQPIRESDSSYTFISPLLAYHIPSANSENKMLTLEDKILKLITDKKQNKKLTDVSLFFSQLKKGRWVGINENASYTPASLMKVALMMAYFKKAEQDTTLLTKNYLYSKQINDLAVTTIFDTPSQLVINKQYSVDELIQKMIVDSDNGAKTLLLANLETTYLTDLFNSLSIPNPFDTINSVYQISPIQYSLLFRILYNATYLTRSMSNKALTLLSQTTFTDGLVAGLPANTLIAHKFGENVSSNSANNITGFELHDCGIVYFPPEPYFTCIMTKGTDLETLKQTIRDISGLLYTENEKMNSTVIQKH